MTRIDRPEAMLIAPDQAYFLRENMKLRLLNARLALLSRQFDTAQSDLASVQSLIERYHDRSSRRTQLAQEMLRQVRARRGGGRQMSAGRAAGPAHRLDRSAAPRPFPR
ncbi:uroporphyrinogen-III C-methyltransferase [Piscinibacter sakaiensis]